MRTAFSIIFSLAILSGLANAQEAGQKYGFVRLVNAVAQGTGPLQLLIDGENINQDGYKLGDVTGGIGLKIGAHQIAIKREGIEEGTTKVNIAADETTTLIPFAEQVPASDDKPAHWEIKILRLKQQDPETDRTATFVSVSRTPEIKVEMRDLKGEWSASYVKRLSVARAPIKYVEGFVPIKTQAGPLPSIPIDERGNYVVVLYDDAEGKMQCLNLQDFKYLSAD